MAENADKDDTPLLKDLLATSVDRTPKRKKITEKISSKRSKTPAPSWTASCSSSCTDARTESWTESRNEIRTEISTEIGKESTVEVNPECNYCKKCKLPYVNGAHMIECECCDYWYHFECENVVVGQENTDWRCSDCLKMFAESEANQKTGSNQGNIVDEPDNFNDPPESFNNQPDNSNNQPGNFNDQADDVYDQSVDLFGSLDQFCDYLMQAPVTRKLEPMLQQSYAKLGMVLFKYDTGKN